MLLLGDGRGRTSILVDEMRENVFAHTNFWCDDDALL